MSVLGPAVMQISPVMEPCLNVMHKHSLYGFYDGPPHHICTNMLLFPSGRKLSKDGVPTGTGLLFYCTGFLSSGITNVDVPVDPPGFSGMSGFTMYSIFSAY